MCELWSSELWNRTASTPHRVRPSAVCTDDDTGTVPPLRASHAARRALAAPKPSGPHARTPRRTADRFVSARRGTRLEDAPPSPTATRFARVTYSISNLHSPTNSCTLSLYQPRAPPGQTNVFQSLPRSTYAMSRVLPVDHSEVVIPLVACFSSALVDHSRTCNAHDLPASPPCSPRLACLASPSPRPHQSLGLDEA